jgi:carboxypeptidase C (cathepsin A)
VLYENGPYTLNKAGTALEETEFGWDVMNNMIFVDQPIGSGFSFSEVR